jgi:hypothetical protein
MVAAAGVLPFRPRRSRHRVVAARFAAVCATDDFFGSDDHWGARFRIAAEELGPVFVSFCDYLATRIDLLPVGDGLALARPCAAAARWPVAAVKARIDAELEHPGALLHLSADPVVMTPFAQTHEARLASGERVHVEVVTLDEEAAARDLELLPLVRHAWRDGSNGLVLAAVIADFHAWFTDRCDCRRRLPLALAATARVRPGALISLAVPRPDLCSAHVFVSAMPGDRTVPPPGAGEPRWQRPSDTALEVVSGWLRQAVCGEVVPVLATGSVMAQGRSLTTCQGFVRLPERAHANITEYLLALAGDVPDRAWDALAHELTPVDGAAPRDEVARAFRCLVPFRDDRSCDSGSEIADRAFLQWRTATKHGWVPSAHLAIFYQGFVALMAAVRGSAPGGDVLAEALRGLRVESTVRQFDEWSQRLDVMSAMERQMTLLLQLPQKIDQLLTVAAEGSVRVQLVTDDRRAARRLRAAALVAALMVASGVLALAGAVVPWPDAWSAPTQSAGLLVAGGVLVWAAGRVL